ncbi:M61 family metallopeptidase [bacterium]|nr:M61 family metallopeptidase [bacterium]
MIRFLFALAILLAAPRSATAQSDINYDVTWDSPEDHYYNVSMEIGGLTNETVDVRMPAWRPGRYVMQNYARYVIGFEAKTAAGKALPFEKIDKDTWRIVTLGENQIVVKYQNYANVLDAGESYLDETEAYLNPISVLMNVSGRMQEPVGLTIQQPANWTVISALKSRGAANSFVAADYHELVDSPFLVSPDVEMLTFETHGATFDIAVQGDWEFDRDRLIADHKAIVEAQIDIIQVVPFSRYLFMYHIVPDQAGHGVEHKNSTSIVLGPSAAMTMPANGGYADGMYRSFLGVASHELFHAWNVERIRPAAMYPTDYSKEQYTTQMWIFEGITDYYADVALHRAGLTTEKGLLSGLAGTVGAFDQDPGRKITSVAMSSFDSWSKQNDAPPGTFYSFYTAGKSMGLFLDMEVRSRTNGERSLDDVFRYLYKKYPEQDRGVPESGFQSALESVSGSSFQSFFDNHIYGTEDVDWEGTMIKGGLTLEQRAGTDPAPWMRVYLGGMTILALDPSGPVGALGLKNGDSFTKIGDTPVTDQASFEAAFSAYAPGDIAKVIFLRDGEEHTVELEIKAAPIQLVLQANPSASDSEDAIRRSWLSGSN